IVNASADSYADVQLEGEMWRIVALDGMPLAYHNPERPLEEAGHVLLPPASRLEAIVTGPPAAVCGGLYGRQKRLLHQRSTLRAGCRSDDRGSSGNLSALAGGET